MNLLKIIRWSINPQKYFLGSTLGSIRYQTTDIPPKDEAKADVSTNVKPMKKSNLMEFFDVSDNLYESKIIHGKIFVLFGSISKRSRIFLNRSLVVFG